MIRFKCSGCGQPLHVPPDLAGKSVRCAGCKQPVQVPAAAPGLALHECSTKADTLGSSEDLPGSPPGPDPDQGLYDFLSPPQEPGERGRLGRFRILGKLGQGGIP